jgi:hypothetical protein
MNSEFIVRQSRRILALRTHPECQSTHAARKEKRWRHCRPAQAEAISRFAANAEAVLELDVVTG